MENLVGKNNILNKAYCLKMLLFLCKNNVLINDLIYALSCLELIDENRKINDNMQTYNPMLFIKKNIFNTLKLCAKLNLIYINNHYLHISEEGRKYIFDLIETKDVDIVSYIKKIEILQNENYNYLYNELIKRKD